MNYHNQKICWTPTYDIQWHWTGVSTLLGLISSVYHKLHHWRSNQRPQIAVPKLYNWTTNSNQLVMLIVRPNNLNVSSKLYPYTFQRKQSPLPLGHVLPRSLEIHIGGIIMTSRTGKYNLEVVESRKVSLCDSKLDRLILHCNVKGQMFPIQLLKGSSCIILMIMHWN